MNEKVCDNECLAYYLSAGAIDAIVWLSLATVLLYYRTRIQESDNDTTEACEMVEDPQDHRMGEDKETLVYCKVDFSENRNRKKPDPENPTVYSSVVFNDNKKKEESDDTLVYSTMAFNKTAEKKQSNTSDSDITYASLNFTPKTQSNSSELYAAVNKDMKKQKEKKP